MADFITEWLETQIPPAIQNLEYWEMYFDGSLQLSGVEAGIVLFTPQKDPLKYVLQMQFQASNNAAEYEALLHGLRVAVSLDVKRLDVYGYSMLVIGQINKAWDAHDDHMMAYRQEVQKLEDKFHGLCFSHILRENNSAADELTRLGSSRQEVPPGVFLQVLSKPSIKMVQKATITEIKTGDAVLEEKIGEMVLQQETEGVDQLIEVMVIDFDWRTPYIEYLQLGKLPEEKVERQRLEIRARNYLLVEDELYRRGVNILMKCVSVFDGVQMLEEIHKRICRNHMSSMTVSLQIMDHSLFLNSSKIMPKA